MSASLWLGIALALTGAAALTGCHQAARTDPVPASALQDPATRRPPVQPRAPSSGTVETLRADTLQERVQGRLAQYEVPIARIRCPDDVPAIPGARFSCQVELGKTTYVLDGTIRDVHLARQNGAIDFAWRDGLAVRVAKLTPMMQATLAKHMSIPIMVDCGDEPLRFLDAQGRLVCAVTAGRATATLTMEFDDHGNLGPWKVEPALVVPSRIVQLLTPEVRERTNPHVEIDCGPEVAYPRPEDGIVWCVVKDGGRRVKLQIALDAKLDLQHWWLIAPAPTLL